MAPRFIRLDDIRIDATILPRLVDPNDEDGHVTRLAADMEAGDPIPAIEVQASTLTLIDGLHRIAAARRLGRAEILAVEVDIRDDELQRRAWERNSKHGKGYTSAQWITYFKLCDEHGWWTTRTTSVEIQKRTGLGPDQVRKYRREAAGVTPPPRTPVANSRPTARISSFDPGRDDGFAEEPTRCADCWEYACVCSEPEPAALPEAPTPIRPAAPEAPATDYSALRQAIVLLGSMGDAKAVWAQMPTRDRSAVLAPTRKPGREPLTYGANPRAANFLDEAQQFMEQFQWAAQNWRSAGEAS